MVISLLYSSSHPSHVKNSSLYFQFLRLCHLCSEDYRDYSLKSEEIYVSFTNVAIPPLLFKWVIIGPNKLIGSLNYKRLRGRIMKEFHSPSHFTLTFHPHNHAAKYIILKHFKWCQNDPDTVRIFLQPPLISFKRDKT